MDQPYSAWADWLSKFHTWPEFIQALWLVAVPLTVLGVTWLVMRGVRELAAPRRQEPRDARGRLVYGVYQDGQGRWMVYRYGRPTPSTGATRRRNWRGRAAGCWGSCGGRRGEGRAAVNTLRRHARP